MAGRCWQDYWNSRSPHPVSCSSWKTLGCTRAWHASTVGSHPLPRSNRNTPFGTKPCSNTVQSLYRDVATQCAVSALRNNRAISVYFWFIAKDPRERPGSRNALLGFLRALPTRCNSLQIDNLDELVWSGLQRGWQSQLVDLAGTRLSKGGMDAGQRVRWLGLGMICEPSAYGQRLARTVSGKERLVRHLGRFFVYGDDYWFERPHVWYYALKRFEPADLALIIRLLGRFFARVEPAPFVYRTEEGQVSRFLERFINDLASRPCNSASESLDSLSDDPELPSWHGLLSVARTAQRRLRRDAEYRHPTIQQACETLTGGRPANACDLAALTVDKIDAIAHRIRTSNSNEWRQYWNEGPHGVPNRPKVEEACRDALLAALRPLLPESVAAEPEVQHVNQTRADLAITAGDFRIPIEAKKKRSRRSLECPRQPAGGEVQRSIRRPVVMEST